MATDDCWATYRELEAKGVEFIEKPEERFYGIDAAFRDPFGNHWRLTQPKPIDPGRAEGDTPLRSTPWLSARTSNAC